MANDSSSSHIYASVISNLNGTINTSCPSSETDYTIYCKVALIFLFLVVSALISGFATLASSIRSLAQVAGEHRCRVCRSHPQDVEARPSTSLIDELEIRERALEVGPTGEARPQAAEPSDYDLGSDTRYPSSTRHSSSPPSRERQARKMWKKVQTAMSNGRWATHTMNAVVVATACLLGGPPSLQVDCNLPAPVTESRRS
ncbi:hypothetical protein LXA43DRAFT_609225 [Ganoderma leucocontextum]|nr:hypothetical protein LXA43DRAFT_609225 [Ganoderma leucocontextum]